MKKQNQTEAKLQMLLLSTFCAGLTISACSDEAHSKSIETNPKQIVVAVIDTGLDIEHRDIKNNLWTNVGETGFDSDGHDKSSNGLDDDLNGFVDDVHGWNFVDSNKNLEDKHGHGTHIAGLVAGKSAGTIKIMPLKYFDPKSNLNNLNASIQAIRYAIKMKADIINYSGGGMEPSLAEYNALKEAEAAGIILVAAAGNEGQSTIQAGFYPAMYKLKNIISVAACDSSNKILESSNFGSKVTFAELGKDIESSMPQNKYGKMTGTSQATARITHALALLKLKFPEANAEDLSFHLARTGDFHQEFIGKVKYQTRVNLDMALSEKLVRFENAMLAQYNVAKSLSAKSN